MTNKRQQKYKNDLNVISNTNIKSSANIKRNININNIKRIVGEDDERKIYRLLDFSDNPRDISDPWYTGNFEIAYNDIVEGLECFFNYLNEKEKINEN